jgi:predicted DsbA family dithiol-disulfide isomerase
MAKRKQKRTANLPLEVDMVSDFVCPWCWLGYRQFQRAADRTKPRPVLTFRPYMLDPSVPEGGADYRAYMKDKFGDKPDSRWTAMREHLETEGPNYGIAFDFKAITRRPNTLDAHRLMRWAQGQDVGEKCAVALFKAYLERGEDIGDHDVLCRIAGEIGLDAELTRDLLAGEDDKIDIQNEVMFFRGLGVSGVPTFIYAGQMAVQGAQPPEAHRKVMADAALLET